MNTIFLCFVKKKILQQSITVMTFLYSIYTETKIAFLKLKFRFFNYSELS